MNLTFENEFDFEFEGKKGKKMDNENTGTTPNNGNLKKPWKPGESGNPNGRPTGSKNGLRSHLQRILSKQVNPNIIKELKKSGINLESKEYAEALTMVLINKALLEGDTRAHKIIWDQTELQLPKALKVDYEGPRFIIMTKEDMAHG